MERGSAGSQAGPTVNIATAKVPVERAAIDFVRDVYGHLKAIAADSRGQALLKIANIRQGAGVVDAHDRDAFIAAAKTRQWEREKVVRALT